MASSTKGKSDADRVDPGWPQHVSAGDHVVTELSADRAGSLPPFGEVEFPQEKVPYDHPETVINK